MVYVLAQFSIHDRESYQRYAALFIRTLKPFKGNLLAADEQPRIMEGDWKFHKAVLLSFPDQAALEGWYNSTEYQSIVQDRLASTQGCVLMLKGLR
ncbi:MAG TPA: DUF1330 domain-containing protein [Candidatus Angelobacter sp.]|nr:DUF1330 domain-containing protein [Candidatus Angelobacter sp.]